MPRVTDALLISQQALSPSVFDMSALLTGTVTVPGPGRLVAQSADGTQSVTFWGFGLGYTPGGTATGTVIAMTVSIGGAPAASILGLDTRLADIVTLAPEGGEAVQAALLQGNNRMFGSASDDVLSGGLGRDTLFGGAGNDVLIGGAGGDELTGGRGADLFIFSTLSDSAAGLIGRDTITDFNRAEGDLIDFSALGALSFTEGGRFTGNSGEIIATATRRGMLVEVDLDGDLRADVAVMVNGVSSIRASDFAIVTLE